MLQLLCLLVEVVGTPVHSVIARLCEGGSRDGCWFDVSVGNNVLERHMKPATRKQSHAGLMYLWTVCNSV